MDARPYLEANDNISSEKELSIVVERYPNSVKVAASLLKLGTIHENNGKSQLARQTFLQIKKKFPGTSAARLADQKLELLNERTRG